MKLTFKLHNGDYIDVVVSSLGYCTVYDDNNRHPEECILEFDTSSKDPVINYRGEDIHLSNFIYISYEDLVEKVNQGIKTKDVWLVSNAEILTTFIKETDKVGIVVEVNYYDTISETDTPEPTGTIEVVMIPVIDRYKKNDWNHKIELEAENQTMRNHVEKRTLYFSDLADMIRRGVVKLVNREENYIYL